MSDVNINNIPNGATVTISVKINMTIGTNEQFVVQAKANHSLASKIKPEIDATHRANLPMMSEEVSDDPRDLEYIVLESVSSMETIVLAADWLTSITIKDTTNYNLLLTNISTEEYQGLVKILNNYGLSGRFKLTEKA